MQLMSNSDGSLPVIASWIAAVYPQETRLPNFTMLTHASILNGVHTGPTGQALAAWQAKRYRLLAQRQARRSKRSTIRRHVNDGNSHRASINHRKQQLRRHPNKTYASQRLSSLPGRPDSGRTLGPANPRNRQPLAATPARNTTASRVHCNPPYPGQSPGPAARQREAGRVFC